MGILEDLDQVEREDEATEAVLAALRASPRGVWYRALLRAIKTLEKTPELPVRAPRFTPPTARPIHPDAETDADGGHLWRRVYDAMLANPGVGSRGLAKIVYGDEEQEGKIRSQYSVLKARGLARNTGPGAWEAIQSAEPPRETETSA